MADPRERVAKQYGQWGERGGGYIVRAFSSQVRLSNAAVVE